VLKTWCFYSMEKIRDPKVRHAELDHLHTVMFKSINLDETIKSSRHMGRRWWRVLIPYNLVLLGQDIFGPIIANSISNLLLNFQIWHVLKPFSYGCITSCMLTFHTYTNYIMGCKLCMSMQSFWMVGLHQVLHSNQDTQVSI